MTVRELIQNLLAVEDIDGQVLINVDGERYHVDDTLHGYDDGHIEISLS